VDYIQRKVVVSECLFLLPEDVARQLVRDDHQRESTFVIMHPLSQLVVITPVQNVPKASPDVIIDLLFETKPQAEPFLLWLRIPVPVFNAAQPK